MPSARIMKYFSLWTMLLVDAYAILCIYLLLLVFSGMEMPHFPFTQLRN